MRPSVWTTGRRILAAPRNVLAFLAGNSVFWWVIPDFIELTGGVPVLVFSILTDLRIVAVLFEWALGLYAVYFLLPIVLPERIQQDWFRWVLAGVSVGIGIAAGFNALLPSPTVSLLRDVGVTTSVEFGLILYVILVVGGGSIAVAVAYQSSGNVIKGDAVPINLRNVPLAGEDVAEEPARWESILIVSLYLLIICALIGMAIGVVSYLFPLPEVLVLGALGGATVIEYAPWTLDVPRLQKGRADIVDRFARLARYPTRSGKGEITAVVILGGVGVSIVPVVTSMVVVYAILFLTYSMLREPSMLWVAVLQEPFATVIGLWNVSGWFLCLLLPGFYALWYWLRMASRVPYFLERWEAVRGSDAASEAVRESRESDPLPLVSHPPDYLLLPTILLSVSLLFYQWAQRSTAAQVEVGDLLFVPVWPALLAVTALTIRWTYRREPARPIDINREALAHLVPFLLQLMWLVGMSVEQGIARPEWANLSVAAIIVLVIYHVPELVSVLSERH